MMILDERPLGFEIHVVEFPSGSALPGREPGGADNESSEIHKPCESTDVVHFVETTE
jgi:hypothetical protein